MDFWKGVFPAATTQFAADLSVDIAAKQKGFDALIKDGVDGLILLGTCGENNSLEPDEKRSVLRAAREAVAGRVPVVTGVSELTTARAMNESAPDPRRFTDLINRFGDRFRLMAGLDDVMLEAVLLGARGWVSGLTSAFPRESVALMPAAQTRDLGTALTIYRWFMPLLHLNAEHDLVQSIKPAEQIMGRGSERARLPRMPLVGARRAEVIAMVEKAAATRRSLPVGRAA